MGLSDVYLGFYGISYWAYGSFLLISILGTIWKKIRVKNVFIASLIFFIITNFGVWLMGYPKTIEGFVLCYTLAIPFFINSLLGDFFFSYLLKWSFRYSEKKILSVRLSVRTPGFHPDKRGSIPLPSTTIVH